MDRTAASGVVRCVPCSEGARSQSCCCASVRSFTIPGTSPSNSLDRFARLPFCHRRRSNFPYRRCCLLLRLTNEHEVTHIPPPSPPLCSRHGQTGHFWPPFARLVAETPTTRADWRHRPPGQQCDIHDAQPSRQRRSARGKKNIAADDPLFPHCRTRDAPPSQVSLSSGRVVDDCSPR